LTGRPVSSSLRPMHNLHWIDYAVCVLYLVGISGLGTYFYFKGQKTTKEYFLADRSMGWLPVGLTLMATLTSGIGYLGQPAGSVNYGLITLWQLLALPLSYPLVVYIFMPFYMRLRVYTPYEYLEKRFNVAVRALTSGLFIIWRVTWMAAVIYAPAMVLSIVSDDKIPLKWSVLAMGILSTIYTAVGGNKAVMWTNVVQFFVMFGGMFAAAGVIIWMVPGGLPEIGRTLSEAGKLNFTATVPGWDSTSLFGKFNLYLYTDVTAMALIISATVGKFGNYCVDQAMVQRFLSSRDLKTARQGFLCNCYAYAIYIVIMALVGAALFAFAKHFDFPGSLKKDQIFPYFIAHMMPVGIAGLLVAAIYSASMSSLTGGISSVITAFTNDFYNRFRYKRASLEDASITDAQQRHYVKIGQVATLVLGVVETFLALYVGNMGDLFEIAAKLINGFIGPLFAIFALGMFTRRAHTTPVIIAGVVGSVLTGLTIFAKQLHLPAFKVGFMWPSTVGLVVTFGVGYVLSWLLPRPTDGRDSMTFWGVMRADPQPSAEGGAAKQDEVSSR
jgi:SSS family transporter